MNKRQQTEPEEILKQVDQELLDIQQSSAYKFAVALARMKQQLLKGNIHEKLEFCGYVINTFAKYHFFDCKPRYYFDPIYQLRVNLHSGQQEKQEKQEKQERKNGIFLFAAPPIQYTGGGQRWVQLAKVFQKMGYPVYYYYCDSLNALPLYDKAQWDVKQHPIFKTSVEEVMGMAGEDSLFIFEMPMQIYLPYLKAAKAAGIKTLYEQVDNWKAGLGKNFYNAKVEQYYWEHCDYLSATCRELCELVKPKSGKEVHYNANAVNEGICDADKEYAQPLDLVKGKDKTVIYFGTVWGKWVDWELIRETARSCPDSAFNFIGDRSEAKEAQITESNIHFLGKKLQKDLPAYLRYSDVAIIPFKLDEIGLYVSPIKIFEYLSMEIPVLTTSMPDVRGYPNTYLGDTAQEWAEIINHPIEAASCKEFIMQNSWKARGMDLLEFCHMNDIKE